LRHREDLKFTSYNHSSLLYYFDQTAAMQSPFYLTRHVFNKKVIGHRDANAINMNLTTLTTCDANNVSDDIMCMRTKKGFVTCNLIIQLHL